MKIDLNSDLGESFGPWVMGDDEAMLDIVTTANVACGFHAGDPEIMRKTTAVASAKGVAVGAHPGFADLAGFGRRRMAVTAREVENLIAYQVGAFGAMAALAGGRMTHVKTHGALGNMVAEDEALALAVARGIKAADPSLRFLVMPGQATERAAQQVGLALFREIYADRLYDDDFNLTDRRQPGSVLHDPAAGAAHVLRMLDAGGVVSRSGKILRTEIESVCIHGDSPAAVAMARTVRERLVAAGATIARFGA